MIAAPPSLIRITIVRVRHTVSVTALLDWRTTALYSILSVCSAMYAVVYYTYRPSDDYLMITTLGDLQ